MFCIGKFEENMDLYHIYLTVHDANIHRNIGTKVSHMGQIIFGVQEISKRIYEVVAFPKYEPKIRWNRSEFFHNVHCSQWTSFLVTIGPTTATIKKCGRFSSDLQATLKGTIMQNCFSNFSCMFLNPDYFFRFEIELF